MASEVGVLDIAPENVVHKDRLQPGRMFLVDTEQGRIVDDDELKERCRAPPAVPAVARTRTSMRLDDLPAAQRAAAGVRRPTRCSTRQQAFGYTIEDLRLLMAPMALNGEEAVGSMGTDTPLAVLSDQPQLLFNYFKQLFAQVTNPPIDPIREELVMSLRDDASAPSRTCSRRRRSTASSSSSKSPVPRPTRSCAQIKDARRRGTLRAITLPTLFRGRTARRRAARRRSTSCAASAERDRRRLQHPRALRPRHDEQHGADPEPARDRRRAPPPDPRRHAHAVRPRRRVGRAARGAALLPAARLRRRRGESVPRVRDAARHGAPRASCKASTRDEAVENYMKAVDKGVLKVMTKMGISTLQSYRGAQIFEAIGLNREVIDRYFTWTASRIEGVGLDVIAAECAARHHHAYGSRRRSTATSIPAASTSGGGAASTTCTTPNRSPRCSTRCARAATRLFKKYTAARQRREPPALHDPRAARRSSRATPIPLDEVEPASEIVKRFKTGAMSLGSISREAHENLAIAMNRIGGKSNTGEGGEDPVRYQPRRRTATRAAARSSRSRRAASASPATTWSTPTSCRSRWRRARSPARAASSPATRSTSTSRSIRYSTPGVGLISPPPHHDIYSIEDLAQLIHDLKNANDRARISVKLVAEVGVGTVAAGVSKAKADVVLISGDSGGTGASPLTSIKHAGIPWELGLAETQQMLVAERPARPHPRRDRRPAEDRPRRRGRGAARRRGVRLRVVGAGRVGLHHDARLPPEHLPGRHRDAGPASCARSSRASPSTSSTS